MWAAAAAARLERQLRLGRDAIADSLGLLELPVAVPEVLAPGWVCSTESVRALLPAVGPTELEQGALETAAWYREHGWL